MRYVCQRQAGVCAPRSNVGSSCRIPLLFIRRRSLGPRSAAIWAQCAATYSYKVHCIWRWRGLRTSSPRRLSGQQQQVEDEVLPSAARCWAIPSQLSGVAIGGSVYGTDEYPSETNRFAQTSKFRENGLPCACVLPRSSSQLRRALSAVVESVSKCHLRVWSCTSWCIDRPRLKHV